MLRWIKSHKILSILLLLLITTSTLVASSSLIAIWGIKSFLSDHASEVEIERLELSLWNSDIRIEGLSAKDEQGRRIGFDSFYVDWNMADLWDEQLTINEFSLGGFKLDIELDDLQLLQIGPLALSKFAKPDKMDDSETKLVTSKESISAEPTEKKKMPAKPWAVSLSGVQLSDLEICVVDKTKDFKSLGFPLQNNDNFSACLTFGELLLEQSFTVDKSARPNYQGNIHLARLTLTSRDKHKLAELKDLLFTDLKFNQENFSIEKITLSNIGYLVQEPTDSYADMGLVLESFELESLLFSQQNIAASLVELNLSGLKLYQRASDNELHALLKLPRLNITNFSFAESIAAIESVELNDLEMMERLAAHVEPDNSGLSGSLIRLTGLKLNDAQLQKQVISLGKLATNGVFVDAILQNGELNLAQWLAVTDKVSQSDESAADSSESSEPLKIKLGQFDLANSEINIAEDSTGELVEQKIVDIKLNLGEVMFGYSDAKDTPVAYSMSFAEGGAISGEGMINLGKKDLSTDIKGKIENMNLVSVTRYAARFIGYRIEQGHLNLNYAVKIADKKIDAIFESKLEKFELGELQEHEANEMNEELGVPLPMALNLLRDSDDNIELEIPLKGDMNSPDFSIASIVATVTVKAIKNAVIYQYSPLGMLSLASGVFDLATALRFEPIEFTARNTKLSDAGKAQLEKVISIMNDKPKIKMVICGVATRADMTESAQASARKAGDDSNKKAKVDPKPLIELAKIRQNNVIDYIVSNGKVAKERLLGCNVKLSGDMQMKPLVNISI
ncbi:DUF748 domain-containing protein [Aliikangiella sp. G2MR2-5]|uniref:DUF748 domain-containing protein n=1 Tax=Aliikangiella sp. G2MR2-5 TaxID=2788943 RepID=UPI0018A90A9F|nr:DUF748 domain-containing protein [Aliikangiella sp. G2MR2-5]